LNFKTWKFVFTNVRFLSWSSKPFSVNAALHIVFIDITEENEDIFDFSRCRHFLDHVITQNREFPYNANLGLFSLILGTLCTTLYVFDLFEKKNEENIEILINFIDDVITMDF